MRGLAIAIHVWQYIKHEGLKQGTPSSLLGQTKRKAPHKSEAKYAGFGERKMTMIFRFLIAKIFDMVFSSVVGGLSLAAIGFLGGILMQGSPAAQIPGTTNHNVVRQVKQQYYTLNNKLENVRAQFIRAF
jgi:hypothetical protein